MMPVISSVRNLGGPQRLAGAYDFVGNPFLSSAVEMGQSGGTLAYTLELVPAEREFDWGKSYWYGLASMFVPRFLAADSDTAPRPLAVWLVQRVRPGLAARGGGLGFSVIAEAYLNYGWYGAPVVVCLLGFLLSRVSHWALGWPDSGRVALMACIIAIVPVAARGTLMALGRPLVLYALLPYSLALLAERSRRANYKASSHVTGDGVPGISNGPP
jgi:hypothetical protein